MTKANRRQVQEALQRLGYEPGRVDGAVGRRTRAAIRRFQQSVAAEPTGTLTAEEVSRLIATPTPKPEDRGWLK